MKNGAKVIVSDNFRGSACSPLPHYSPCDIARLDSRHCGAGGFGAAGVGREAREERDVARIAEEPDGADCDDVENRIAMCAG